MHAMPSTRIRPVFVALALAVSALLGACRATERETPAPIVDAASATQVDAPVGATIGATIGANVDATVDPTADELSTLAADPALATMLPSDSRRVLEGADAVTLHSVSASQYREYGYGRLTEPTPLANVLAKLAAGTGVRGSLELTTSAQRGRAVTGLYRGLLTKGPRAHCYEPHHALVFSKGESRVVALICFLCSYVTLIDGTTEQGRLRGFQDPDHTFAQLLNGWLTDAGMGVGD
jgi:hypothetical protein